MANMANANKVFDLITQQNDTSSKIVVGLERISEAFRVLLWEHGKTVGLSPIQIQLLIFLKYHAPKYRKISYLAREFNMTKPTISDAVKVLVKKDLVSKEVEGHDSRSHRLKLTALGKRIAKTVEHFAQPLQQKVSSLSKVEQEELLTSVLKLVSKLNDSEIITVQRTCHSCKFYDNSSGHYCHLLNSKLSANDIRIDCPEFESV